MDSLLKTFQQFKSVLCVCPHCSSLLRLSDLRNLRTKLPAPKTWLDEYELTDKKIKQILKRSCNIATHPNIE